LLELLITLHADIRLSIKPLCLLDIPRSMRWKSYLNWVDLTNGFIYDGPAQALDRLGFFHTGNGKTLYLELLGFIFTMFEA
jgi:hypothetical protein